MRMKPSTARTIWHWRGAASLTRTSQSWELPMKIDPSTGNSVSPSGPAWDKQPRSRIHHLRRYFFYAVRRRPNRIETSDPKRDLEILFARRAGIWRESDFCDYPPARGNTVQYDDLHRPPPPPDLHPKARDPRRPHRVHGVRDDRLRRRRRRRAGTGRPPSRGRRAGTERSRAAPEKFAGSIAPVGRKGRSRPRRGRRTVHRPGRPGPESHVRAIHRTQSHRPRV